MQESDYDKPSRELASSEKSLDLKIFLTECRRIIASYNLETIVAKIKAISPKNVAVHEREKFNCIVLLTETEKDCFCVGMVKLGEAMTFCKDASEEIIKRSGIVAYAEAYSKLRNYIVHHFVYEQLLERYEKLNNYVEMIPFIKDLNEKIIVLEKEENFVLIKKIGKNEGDNFEFEYDHFITCLENEFLKLDVKYNLALTLSLIPMDIPSELKAGLENHVRNITITMLELTDRRSTNFYRGSPKNPCHPQKNIAKKHNKFFEPNDVKCRFIFKNLSDMRKSLSHYLDTARKAFYYNDKGLLEFVGNFVHLSQRGYCRVLRTKIEEKIQARKAEEVKDFVPAQPSLMFFPIAHKTQLEALDSMEKAEEEAKSPKIQPSEYNPSTARASNKQERSEREGLPEVRRPDKKREKKSDDKRISPRGGFK